MVPSRGILGVYRDEMPSTVQMAVTTLATLTGEWKGLTGLGGDGALL